MEDKEWDEDPYKMQMEKQYAYEDIPGIAMAALVSLERLLLIWMK